MASTGYGYPNRSTVRDEPRQYNGDRSRRSDGRRDDRRYRDDRERWRSSDDWDAPRRDAEYRRGRSRSRSRRRGSPRRSRSRSRDGRWAAVSAGSEAQSKEKAGIDREEGEEDAVAGTSAQAARPSRETLDGHHDRDRNRDRRDRGAYADRHRDGDSGRGRGADEGRDRDTGVGRAKATADVAEEEELEAGVEDEEAREAQRLEDSKRRRDAILAKHMAIAPIALSAAPVIPSGLPAPTPRPNPVTVKAEPTGAALDSYLVPAASDAGAGVGGTSMFEDDWDTLFRIQAGANGAGVEGTGGATALRDTYDDSEGYYRARPGEAVGPEGRYIILAAGGRGVFSSVLFARDTLAQEAGATGIGAQHGASGSGPGEALDDAATLEEAAAGTVATAAAPVAVGSTGALVKQHAALARGSKSRVAIKVIRSNDTMRRAGQVEIDILRILATADPTGKYHTIRLLDTFEHRGHLCLVFEAMASNLKEVQTRFGKGVGLALRAVREYAAQLLLSLALCAKLRVIHADIKPHNVLASERFNVVKLADFGSAFREDDPDNVPTPYLVSRFYRAPEVVLGALHTPALDMWSLACCLAELYTGSPLFPGEDNNDMLWRQQSMRGKFPHRLLRRHVAHCSSVAADPHFEPDTLRFRRHALDPVSKLPKVVLMDVTEATESLAGRLSAKRAGGEDKRALAAFADLLDRMLALDPERRLTPVQALAHPFIREKMR